MKKLAIFDLDGTLVNSVADLGNACNHALEQLGFPTHSRLTYNSLVGNGVTRLIERALPEDARRTRVVESMRTRFMEFYNEHLWDETVPYPGIMELLQSLVDKDVKLAVASNKYQEATARIVEHFFSEFPWAAVQGHREMMPLKPDPSIVFSILLECPTAKADTILIGDSGVDMETGYRACVDTVGVTWGFRKRSELVAARADNIVNTPEEILPIILGATD